MVWADMKFFIASKMCSTLDEVKQAIKEYHKALTPEKCQSFIFHLQEVKLKTYLKLFT
jgi:hypothetical protein